jgi:hypothetical protein
VLSWPRYPLALARFWPPAAGEEKNDPARIWDMGYGSMAPAPSSNPLLTTRARRPAGAWARGRVSAGACALSVGAWARARVAVWWCGCLGGCCWWVLLVGALVGAVGGCHRARGWVPWTWVCGREGVDVGAWMRVGALVEVPWWGCLGGGCLGGGCLAGGCLGGGPAGRSFPEGRKERKK